MPVNHIYSHRKLTLLLAVLTDSGRLGWTLGATVAFLSANATGTGERTLNTGIGAFGLVVTYMHISKDSDVGNVLACSGSN